MTVVERRDHALPFTSLRRQVSMLCGGDARVVMRTISSLLGSSAVCGTTSHRRRETKREYTGVARGGVCVVLGT